MMTVAPSLVSNTLTPVVDSTAAIKQPQQTSVSGVLLPEGFSSAFNTQLNLLLQPAITQDAALVTAPVGLVTTTTIAPTLETTLTENVASSDTQQSAVVPNSMTQNPNTALDNQQIAVSLDNATQNTSPFNMAMTAEDTAILSTVTDTLRFIKSGFKLGDTLSAGQSAQLSTANSSVPLLQQSVQSAVNQAVTNKLVNTPVSVLAWQITPVTQNQTPVVTTQETPTPVTQIQTTAVTELQTPMAVIQNQTPAVVPETPTAEIPVHTTAVTAQETPTPETQVHTTAVIAQETPTPETQVHTTAVIAQKTPTPETQVHTTAVVPETPTPETPVETTAITEPQTLSSTEVKTPTVMSQETPTPETPVETTAITEPQTLSSTEVQTPTVIAQEMPTPEIQNQTPAATAISADPVQATTAEFAKPGMIVEAVRFVDPKTVGQKIKIDIADTVTNDVPTGNAELLATAQSVVSPQEQSSEKTTLNLPEQKIKTTDDLASKDAPILQAVAEIAAPIATAQAAPVQVDIAPATFESSNKQQMTEDKLALTPAKNLLADALANRNSGDTSSNSSSNKGNDTSSNPTLQGDTLINQSLDNKQNADTKTFASLLSSEKLDISAPPVSAPTTDKVAPQMAATTLNNARHEIKADVPALTRPLSHPDWNQEMGERVVWMNNRGISSAEININPPNMGPISVRIDMNQDQATVTFTAQNVAVRDALEASIPKLREMLSSQQVTLADVNVSQNDSGRSQQQAAQQMADASANGQGNRQNNQGVDAQGNLISQNSTNDEGVIVDDFANGQVLGGNGANGLLSIFA